MDKRVWLIFFIMLVNLLGVGIILPFLPYYAEKFGTTPLVIGFLASTYPFFQLISSPFLGNLSDKLGRRPLLLFSLLGTIVGFFILGFANNLFLLFLARFVDGISAGNVPVAFAYISDITDDTNRTRALSIIKSSFGIGFVLGPVIGGILSQFGYGVPAIFAGVITFIGFLLAYFILHEPYAHKQPDHPFTFKAIFEVTYSKISSRIFVLLIMTFLLDMTLWTIYATLSLFTKHALHFSTMQTGYVFMMIEIIGVVVQFFLLQKLLGIWNEEKMLVSSLVVTVGGLILLLLSHNIILLLISLGIFSLGIGAAVPLVTGIASRESPSKEQGNVLGLLSSASSLATLIAPLVGTYAFSLIITGQFVVSAIFGLITLIVSFFLLIKSPRSN